MQDLTERVVVVTGAGSGIGRELALQAASSGASLAINDFNAETLEETAAAVREHGAAVYSRAFDVGSREAMDDFAAGVQLEYGRVDTVINNAGVALGQMNLEHVSTDDFQWIVNVNLWGVVHGTMAFLPHLREQFKSRLVNVCSSFGLLAVPGQAAYCTTKFAVRGFTDSLRLELMDTGVGVTLVSPSQVKSNIIRNGRHQDDASRADLIRKFDTYMTRMTPAEAATIIWNGLARGKDHIVVGGDAKLFSFASRFLPRFVIRAATRRSLRKIAEL